MTDIRPRRSALYVPASNMRALGKAKSLDVDVVILDLEDAVAPEAKDEARRHAQLALSHGGFGRSELVIRVNAPGSPWFEADMAAAAAAGPDAVLIPKVSDAETLRAVGARLSALGAPERTKVWAMIETARSLLALDAIAACAEEPATRLAALVVGTNDLARETRARLTPGRAPMLPWLSNVVAAARAHGLVALDGVHNDFADDAGGRAQAGQSRDLGFDGKTLIHPRQVEAVNAAFSPTHDEIARARAVVAAFALPENRGRGAIALDGVMVERLHAEMAERVLALAAAISREG